VIEDEFALGLTSIPASSLRSEVEPRNAEGLIEELGLVPWARMTNVALPKVLTALVVNETAEEMTQWLLAPPDVVEIEVLERPTAGLGGSHADRSAPREPRSHAPTRRRLPGPKEERRKLPKGSADAARLEQAVAVATAESVLPFARSPVDMTALNELLNQAQGATTWIVSPRTNPFVLLELPVGFILIRAVQGVGQGIRRGLSDVVYYKLLRLFRVPEDRNGN
jgi:hypothetical protein